MAKNKLIDLNDHLFQVIEDLNNPETDMNGNPLQDFDKTIKRAIAVAKVGQVIVNNAKLHLQAVQLMESGKIDENLLPETIKNK